MKRKVYKTTRKYSCPYCDKKMTRQKLLKHVDEDHPSMIPEGYSAARVIYEHINHKNYGICMNCGAKVYEWDPVSCRYKNICSPKCLEDVRNKAKKNKLDDPEKQKVMLAARKISGSYKFSDGTVHTYVGSYEKKALEFMDLVLNIKGTDLVTPGPTIEYEYEGETHTWILDMLYLPSMLAIDCKDGGDNPNNRPMQSYREKQLAKEDAIAKQNKYNYLRLTDNDFGQLLSAMADIRYGMMVEDPEKGIYIHEAVGGIPPAYTTNYYVIPYGMKGMNTNDIEGFTFGNTTLDRAITFDRAGNKKELDEFELRNLLQDKEFEYIFFKNRDLSGVDTSKAETILEALLGFPYTSMVDFCFCEDAFIIANNTHQMLDSLETGIRYYTARAVKDSKYYLETVYPLFEEKVKQATDAVSIMKDVEGYYLVTPEDYPLVSNKFASIVDIPQSMIDAFDDLYKTNTTNPY